MGRAGRISRELDQRVVELQSLFEMSQVLNSSLQLNTILNNLLLTPMGRMMISRGMVLVTDESGGMTIKVIKGLDRDLLGKRIPVKIELSKPSRLADLEEEDCRLKRLFEEIRVELILPILSTRRTVGLIALGSKIGGEPFDTTEIEFLSSLSNIAATSIENALMFERLRDVNRRLDKKIQELNTLFDIGKELNSTLDPEKITNLLIYAVMGEMVVNRCVVFTRQNDSLQLTAAKGDIADTHALRKPGLIRSLGRISDPTIIDQTELPRTLSALKRMNFKVIVPMHIQEANKGFILLGEKINKNPYYPEELEFLSTLSNQAMISLENARLFEEALEKERMEEELNIARDIQRRLLPGSFPEIKGVEIVGMNIPSRHVGGDYYDCIQFDEGHIALTIADVSGKGVPASLLMSNLQASLHSLMTGDADISATVSRINDLIYAHTDYDRFITFFYAVLDVEQRSLLYVNAGHNPPYLVHEDGQCETLETGGLLLGMMPDREYEKEKIDLRPGDLLLLFTDGVTEAKDVKDREFEEQRLQELLIRNRHRTMAEIIKTVIDALTGFTAGAAQADDITMLGLKLESSTS